MSHIKRTVCTFHFWKPFFGIQSLSRPVWHAWNVLNLTWYNGVSSLSSQKSVNWEENGPSQIVRNLFKCKLYTVNIVLSITSTSWVVVSVWIRSNKVLKFRFQSTMNRVNIHTNNWKVYRKSLKKAVNIFYHVKFSYVVTPKLEIFVL